MEVEKSNVNNMNIRHINLFFEILRLLIESDGSNHIVNLIPNGYKHRDTKIAIYHLMEINLIGKIDNENDIYYIKLKGLEAYNIGIPKYMNELKEKEKLEIRNLKGNVFQVSKWWVILLINVGLTALLMYLFN